MKNKIIISDGIPPINQMWEYRLKTDGYDVKVIQCCNETLSYLQGHNVDLVIVELYSSTRKGLNLIESIRDKISPTLPILSILETYDEMLIEAIHEKGCLDYMVIPFWAGELSFRVNRLLFCG